MESSEDRMMKIQHKRKNGELSMEEYHQYLIKDLEEQRSERKKGLRKIEEKFAININPKFYVASSFQNVEAVQFVSGQLQNMGYVQTYDWTKNNRASTIKDLGCFLKDCCFY